MAPHYFDNGQRLFICGDGAAWVKKVLKVIPKSVFVLKLFHLDR
ncbi:MAG: UPF0236 family transposase-like protein [Bacillota bacterium]